MADSTVGQIPTLPIETVSMETVKVVLRSPQVGELILNRLYRGGVHGVAAHAAIRQMHDREWRLIVHSVVTELLKAVEREAVSRIDATPVREANVRVAGYYLDCPTAGCGGGMVAPDGSYIVTPDYIPKMYAEPQICEECGTRLVPPSALGEERRDG